MKFLLFLNLSIVIFSCNSTQSTSLKTTETKTETEIIIISQADLENEKIKNHDFLDCMYSDTYFPEFLVDKCKNILLELCRNIEEGKPEALSDLYKLTHASTEKINDLEEEFFENGSEIETAARECLGMNFEFVSIAYGFEADIEELIAPRTW